MHIKIQFTPNIFHNLLKLQLSPFFMHRKIMKILSSHRSLSHFHPSFLFCTSKYPFTNPHSKNKYNKQSNNHSQNNHRRQQSSKQFRYKNRQNLLKILPNYESYQSISQFLNKSVHRRCIVEEQQELLTKRNIEKWVPVLIDQFSNGKQSANTIHTISQLFMLCEDLKIFRSQLFQAAYKGLQKNINNIQNQPQLSSLANIYGALINLWQQNTSICSVIRQKIQTQFSQKTYIDKYSDFLLLVYFLQSLTLDKNTPNNQKAKIFQSIKQPFTKYARKIQKNQYPQQQKLCLQISILYDTMCVNKLQIDKDLRKTIKNIYDKIAINVEYQSSEINDVRQMLKNTNYIKSRFQLIFEKKLKEMGYQFESNLMLKGNQYDFLIKGIKQKKNLPLAGISDIKSTREPTDEQPFSLQLAQNIGNSQNVDFYQCDEIMQQPVLLQINGPYHKIDTDTPLQQSIICRQMFKFQKLPLYGIKAYNIVDFVIWQQKNKFPGLSEQYVSSLVNNPRMLI